MTIHQRFSSFQGNRLLFFYIGLRKTHNNDAYFSFPVVSILVLGVSIFFSFNPADRIKRHLLLLFAIHSKSLRSSKKQKARQQFFIFNHDGKSNLIQDFQTATKKSYNENYLQKSLTLNPVVSQNRRTNIRASECYFHTRKKSNCLSSLPCYQTKDAVCNHDFPISTSVSVDSIKIFLPMSPQG